RGARHGSRIQQSSRKGGEGRAKKFMTLQNGNPEGKTKVGIIGSGNIGTDLLLKLLRSPLLEPAIVVGIDPNSTGLAIAREHGVEGSPEGIDALLERRSELKIVFDASGAKPHIRHAPRLEKAG